MVNVHWHLVLHDTVKMKMALPANPPSNDIRLYNMRYADTQNTHYYFLCLWKIAFYLNILLCLHISLNISFLFICITWRVSAMDFKSLLHVCQNEFHSYNSFSEINFIELHKYIPKYHTIAHIFYIYKFKIKQSKMKLFD